MFGFRSPLQEGHRGGVCYVYMYSATDGGFAFYWGLSGLFFCKNHINHVLSSF